MRDFVAARGYRLAWTHEDDRLLERGSAVLERALSEFAPPARADARRAANAQTAARQSALHCAPWATDTLARRSSRRRSR
jgi:hypothetical protein